MGLLTAIEMGHQAASLVSWGGVSDMVLTYEERKDMRRMMKRVIGGTPKRCRMNTDGVRRLKKQTAFRPLCCSSMERMMRMFRSNTPG